MTISVVYLVVRCLLSCLTALTRHQVSKDAELLVPRHENAVLRGQIDLWGSRSRLPVLTLVSIGSPKADVPQQIFLGTLVQSVVVVAASLIVANFPTGRADGKSSCSPRQSCTAWRCS